MPSTRASARLAKTKGKRTKATTNDVDDVQGRDDDYEQVESDEEKEPPRKRQRAAEKPTKAVTRKKQVRGKQGRLADLVNMPVDIFTEVASHLLPGDIISLARSNKFFRNLLMHRSATHIWHQAMKNVEGLPPCPPNMSEPHYLALLFSKTCSMCGAPARANMDTVLLVRLCASCRNTRLMPLGSVPLTVMPWVVYSTAIAPQKRRHASAYVLREEVPGLLAQYEEIKKSNSKAALDAWATERKQLLDSRNEQALVLIKFLGSLDTDREKELDGLKEARRSEIKRRLAEIGWAEEDMEFGSWSTNKRAWRDLVMQAKPLTERIWANIKPKLIPLLETNREERLAAELKERKAKRRHRLYQFFQDIRNQSSALELKAQNPMPQLSDTIPTVRFAYRGPFPEFLHVIEWPLIKNLHETDSSVPEMEARFEERRDEILALINDWKNGIQNHFANRLRDAYDSKGEDLVPTISISSEGTNPLANVSDNLKLLLRADTFFYRSGLPDISKRPLSYNAILASEGLNRPIPSYYQFMPTPPVPNLDKYEWYPEAHEAAQQLLADMGAPDACNLAFNAVGSAMVCGRCHETEPRNWEGMIQHYIEQKQQHAKAHTDEAGLSAKAIVYNNIHDPAVLTDKPMITDYATKSSQRLATDGFGRLHICKVCEKIPGIKPAFSFQGGITQHLRDVHGITDAKTDEHYAPNNVFASGLLGMGAYDYDYDSDESYYMGHNGCDCPFHSMFGHFDDSDDDIYGSGHMLFDDEDEEGFSDEYDYGW